MSLPLSFFILSFSFLSICLSFSPVSKIDRLTLQHTFSLPARRCGGPPPFNQVYLTGHEAEALEPIKIISVIFYDSTVDDPAAEKPAWKVLFDTVIHLRCPILAP
ncbi:hypothetical protein BJX65DRAFT_175094 [Aspergillus insuetus]